MNISYSRDTRYVDKQIGCVWITNLRIRSHLCCAAGMDSSLSIEQLSFESITD